MSEKIRLNNVRLSYLNVFKARAMQEGQEPKFSAQIIIPKDHPQIKELEKKILAVAKEKFPKIVTGSKVPAKLKTPLRDGDDEYEEDEDLAVYGGNYFFNANNTRRPVTIDRDKTPIAEDDGILYSGCYCNVVIELFGYDTAGNKGVAASLGGVQFVRDGEALGGRGTTADDFDEVEVEDNDYSDVI